MLYRLPASTRSSLIYDADELMPGWLYDRYDRFGSRLMTAYQRDRFARSRGCPVCGAAMRLAGKRDGGGFLVVCDNGHDVPGPTDQR